MDAPETANAAHAWPKEIAGLIARLIRLAVLRALLARLGRRRLPVLLQGNAVECGIACLAMVLGYHGRRTRVSELSARIGVGRDGLTAAAIAAAARSYGLMVKSYSLSPADLAHLPLPAIAHWQFNHFVVLERWSPKGVTIVDPAMGRRRLSPEEFDAGFTGVVLTFVPGTHFQRAEKIRAPWRRHLGPYVLGHPGVLLQILGASLLLQILGLALPVFSKVLIDDVLPLETTDVLTVLGIGAVILVLAQAVTTYLRSALLVYLQARVDQRIMLGFFEHLLALPYRFFEQRGTGDLLMRLGSNALIRETLTSQTLSTVLDGSLAVGYLAFLLVQDALLGSLVLTVGLLQVALLILSSRRVHDLNQRELVAEGASQGYLVEALAGIATLKASGAEDRSLDRWSDLFVARLNVAAQRGQMSAAIEAAMTGLRAFAPLGLLWVGASRVLDGTLSLGTMLALQAVAVAALAPLTSLVTNGQRLQLVAAHLDRIAEVLDAEPEQDPTAFKPAPTLSGQIELESVSFRYDPRAPWALQDISLKIDAGQKVALVGRTGSGKSTLAKLLLGLYSPTAGEIRYDGHPASGLELRSLRRQFGVVLQEPTLFGGSIRENIAFGDPGLSFERMVDAARMAEIHDEIMAVPMGYETRIAEGGAGFSGGQRQRIVLARALAQQPSLLLLDEATSSLDIATEAAIERNLTALSCTRIVIAHRLSTVRDADLILVLDQGRIVERGTHEELLLRAGHYANLVRRQLAESAAATATVS